MIGTNDEIWFPEPAVKDDSAARKGEGWFQWVSRATSRKGNGLLAYTAAAIPQVNDPGLYIHQGFQGSLPQSLRDFEVSTLNRDGIHIKPAREKRILTELNLVY